MTMIHVDGLLMAEMTQFWFMLFNTQSLECARGDHCQDSCGRPPYGRGHSPLQPATMLKCSTLNMSHLVLPCRYLACPNNGMPNVHGRPPNGRGD